MYFKKLKYISIRKTTAIKIAVITILAALCFIFNSFSFHTLEALIRDSLQYTNDNSNINPYIKTVNLDIESKIISRPFKSENIESVVKLIQKSNPKYIVLLFEPNDFIDDSNDNRNLVSFLNSQPNVLLGNSVSNPGFVPFSNHPIFSSVKNVFNPPAATTDSNFGAQDKRWRRTLLSFDNLNTEDGAADIKKLGFALKTPEDFKYPFLLWNTKQVYIKTFKVGTFGHYQYSMLLDPQSKVSFKDQVVFVGAFDEFSYLSKPSVFNLFGQLSAGNFKESYYPYQDYIAGVVNMWITGDYIKLISNVNDLWIVFLILSAISLSPFSFVKKFIIFISLIPAYLFFIIILYRTTGFYIDHSRSIALLIFVQYFMVPFAMIWFFLSAERQKLIEINNARIDALLHVSEKVAHDIRSPLSTINLVLTKAKFDNIEYPTLIQSSIKRIESIAESLLRKTKNDNQTATKIPADEVEKIIKALIAEKTVLAPLVKFDFHSAINKNLWLHADTIELERVLSNLIDNSIYALKMKENALITLSTQISIEYLTISVTDNGSGIPENILKILGNQRITTKGPREGNGIGLLHSKRLIESMGGSFSLFSDGHSTTTIKISLKTVVA